MTLGAAGNIDDLVRQVMAGDLDRYAEIIAACEATVRMVLATLVPDRNEIEDLAEEVFLTAFLRLDQYRPETDFWKWIRAIARNLAMNERRRWIRHERFRERYRADFEDLVGQRLDALVSSADADLARHVGDCLQSLAATTRSVVEQRYFADRSCAEIAEQSGHNESWVRVVLHRARAAIADCLTAKGVLTHE